MMPPDPPTVSYTILIHTGAYYPQLETTRKWNDGTMILIINPGHKNQSKKIKITDVFPNRAEGHVMTDHWLPASIGKPKLLKIDLESNTFELIKEALFVREVTIICRKKPYRFPVKNFVYPHNPLRGNPSVARMGCPPHFLVREGAGSLRHHETDPFILNAREEDLATTRMMVKWDDSEKPLLLPGYIKCSDYNALPRFLKLREAKLQAFVELRQASRTAVIKAVARNVAKKLTGTYDVGRFPDFEGYKQFLLETGERMGWLKDSLENALKVASVFDDDYEFGRQMLCGPNALYFKRIKALGERWSHAPCMPEYVLHGVDIQTALAEGRIFEIDCDLLDGVVDGGLASRKLTGTAQTWYITLSDCLLFLDENDKLKPVMIRLEYRNGLEEPTFWYPPPDDASKDSHEALSWLLAKMYFKCTDTQIYAICTHFGRGHALNEMFAVSAYMSLASSHPMHRLLQPHIFGIIPINVQAREVLVNAGTSAFSLFLSSGDGLDYLLDSYFKQFHYRDLIIPTSYELRGVETIPNYLMHDDYMDMWGAILEYTKDIVDLTYRTNDDVLLDEELQMFCKQIVENGLKGFENGAGFPEKISTKEKVTEYFTAIIFNISVFHASVNFQTLSVGGFIPNQPGCMVKPPPQANEIITMDRILDSLPVRDIAFLTMNISYQLQQFSPTEKFFLETRHEQKQGILSEAMMVGEDQVRCMQKFIRKLELIKEKISKRNEGLFIPYDVISPNNIPLTTQT